MSTEQDMMDRYREAVIMGGHRLRVDDHEWDKALTHARRIHEALQNHYSPTFECSAPNLRSFKLPAQYVDGYTVPVPYRTIINIETTMAELHLLATEMERASAEIMDEIIRARVKETCAMVKRTIEERTREAKAKARAHLKVVP